MSLKDFIEQWKNGAEFAEAGRYAEAIDCLTQMAEPGSRNYFNIASMHLRLGHLEDAERNLDLCVKKDPHMALGFFQRGCLHLQNKRFDSALDDFETSLGNLRGNLLIDYKQLGLQYKLYSCEIIYNQAYALHQKGQVARAQQELERASDIARDTTESRHKIISYALRNLRNGNGFMPYKLPKNSMVFWPPRSKTEVLKPVNFMGKAKVLSSIVDQDDYTGFVGVQEKKSRSPSPSGSRSPSPSPVGQRKSLPLPPTRRIPRAPKPDMPPPAPNMKVPSRNSSLHVGAGYRPLILPKQDSWAKIEITPPSPSHKTPQNPPSPGHKPPQKYLIHTSRPPKPDVAPPSTNGFKRHKQVKRTKSSDVPSPNDLSDRHSQSRSPSPVAVPRAMTVKIHYTTTRALRVVQDISFSSLSRLICRKFDQPDDSLVLWYKKPSGDLGEIHNDVLLKAATANLEDGFRLTVWVYDKEEKSSEPIPLKEVMAIADYSAQYSDELSFSAGDRIEVTVEINEDWYEGRCHGNTGIFPISYIRDV